MKWVALFSQTGSELVNIMTQTGMTPGLILTNNLRQDKYKIHPTLNRGRVVSMTHDEIMNTLNTTPPMTVTLHGYLRILDAEVCHKHSIYNGHPGLITKYPELKGKDPQLKVWQNMEKYPIIGSVLHRVTPEVDEGPVVHEYSVPNRCKTQDEVFQTLKETSLYTWLQFFGVGNANWI